VNGYSIRPQISQIYTDFRNQESAVLFASAICGNLRNLRITFPVRHRGGEAIRVHSWLLPKKYFPDENP